MKKVALLVLVMMLFTMLLGACSSQPADNPPASTPEVPEESTGGEEASGDLPPGLQAIVDRGVLRAGVKVDVPNFGYQNPETQEVEGFEIDLLKAIALDLLGDETKIETQAVTARTRGPLLDSQEVDLVVATFTITEERRLSHNFSTPYYTDTVGLLVRADAGFESLADMDGATIGVAQSATSRDAIQDAADELGISIGFSEFASYPEIKTALLSGRVNAFSVDRSILSGYVDDTTVILPDQFSPQDYGIATKLDNKDFAAYLDEFLAELESSGELDALIQKWGLNQ